jgi:hypothetical protein
MLGGSDSFAGERMLDCPISKRAKYLAKAYKWIDFGVPCRSSFGTKFKIETRENLQLTPWFLRQRILPNTAKK